MTTTDISSFHKSYPIDFGLYNDDEQEILSITDDPAGQNLHLEIKNTSTQVITLAAPASATPGSTNYHFALSFRPDTLSPMFQSYLSSAVSTLTGGTPSTTLTGAFQAFAADTTALLQGSLQKQSWKIGYQQESSGNLVLYFLSTNTQTLTPGTPVIIPFAHASASSTGGAHTTRVELHYQQLTFSNDTTPINGRRRVHLSIVNQSGQKHIPLHASFVGFDTILNDGQTQNMLTLRIANMSSSSAIALNPANSHVPSKFFLSFDAQADKEIKDWALGTTSQVHAIQITSADPKSWAVIPPTGQEETPEWTLETQPTKTALAAKEAITLTLTNIISSLASGPAHLSIRYENIPGYWDGQLTATIEKTPLLYRGGNVGIGTATPHGALEIGPNVSNANAWMYFQGNANGVANPSTDVKQGLLFTWNPSGGQGETQLLYTTGLGSTPRLDFGRWNGTTKTIDMTINGGNVGIGTTTPKNQLVVNSQASIGGNTSNTGFEPLEVQGKGAGVSLYDRTGGATGRWVIYSDRTGGAGTETLRFWSGADKVSITQAGSISLGNNTLQQGVNWTTTQIHYHSYPDGPITVAPLTSSNALRIVGGEGGVLATSSTDVLCWASYGIVVKGNIWAENKYFRITHPAKPDHYLIHACLEGPESSVYYRGQAQLTDGRVTIHLPDYFEALTCQEGRTVLLTPRGREPFLLSADEIVDGMFRVYGTKIDGTFSWEVKAVRSDVERLEPEIANDRRI